MTAFGCPCEVARDTVAEVLAESLKLLKALRSGCARWTLIVGGDVMDLVSCPDLDPLKWNYVTMFHPDLTCLFQLLVIPCSM